MILFTHFSLLVLSVAIVSLVALIEVSRSDLIDNSRKWLRSHLACTFVFNLVLFADHSLYTSDTRYFFILRYPTVLLIALSYVELSYAAAGYTGTLHRKIYRTFVGIASLFWFYGLYTAVAAGANYYSSSYNILLSLPIVLFLWPGLLFWFGFRRQGITITPVSNFRSLWRSFSNIQKAAFAFWGVALLRFFSATTPVLERATDMPQEAIWTFFYVNNLLTLSAMTIIYHAYIEKRANLASRIMYVCTVALLSAFAIVVLFSYSKSTVLRGSDMVAISQNSLEFSPSLNGYVVKSLDPVWRGTELTRQANEVNKPVNIKLPFSFPFYGHQYDRLIIYPDGQVVPTQSENIVDRPLAEVKLACIYDQPVIAAFCLPNSNYEIFVNIQDDNEAIFVWARKMSDGAKDEDYAVQLILSRTGTVIVNFANVETKAPIARHNAVGIHNGSGLGEVRGLLSELPLQSTQDSLWFDLTYGRRLTTHEQLRPVLMYMAITIALVFFVIRPYISALLVSPLEKLRRSLKNVDDGQFDKELKVRPGDEFGDIATSFNTMIHSLKEARQRADEQTELLEAEITFRTLESTKTHDTKLMSKDQAFERKLYAIIKDNIGDFDFQVDTLADLMAVSTRQLYRRVVSLTAQTPAALIRKFRLEHGHRLLSAKAVNVSEAAHQSGFKDVGYFSKLFQDKYGQTPAELLGN